MDIGKRRGGDARGEGGRVQLMLGMQRQRVSGDYLQTSAIIDATGAVSAAVNDPNLYSGPGTGYRLEGERWEQLQRLPHELDARALEGPDAADQAVVAETEVAGIADRADDVVIAVGPAFADHLRTTIGGLAHRDVLQALLEGIREAGGRPVAPRDEWPAPTSAPRRAARPRPAGS